MPIRLLLWLTVALVIALPSRAEDTFLAPVVATPSGNEVRVRLDRWAMTVRLHGVEPPSAPKLAAVAREYLRRRVEGTRVRVEVKGTAARGVIYGNVYPSDRNESLNHEMIACGLGLWSERYAPDRIDLRFRQNAARAAGVGLWGGLEVDLPPFASKARRPLARRREPKPTPSPAPAPAQVVVTPPTRSRWPILLLVVVGAGLMGGSARIAVPIRRARRPLIPLGDPSEGLVRATGIARPLVGVVSSASGRVPGLFVRERTWRYTGRNWRLERDDAEGVSFLLEDATGTATVAGDRALFFPARVARFYNDVPVDRWYDRSYPSDTRTEVHYLPPHAPVTVIGERAGNAFEDSAERLWVVEGAVGRVVRRSAWIAAALGFGSVTSFVAALVLSLR